jgi:RNA ligase (TIGR02306 family)
MASDANPTAVSPGTNVDAAVDVDRTLVSVETITEFIPIDGADQIQLAKVLGWQVVVRIQDFALHDRVLFYRIDGILPKECPYYATLELGEKPLRSRKIRGVLSQGLVGPLEWARWHKVDPETLVVGQDCTALFGIRKNEEGEPVGDQADATGKQHSVSVLPWDIPKTKENRVQDVPKRIRSLIGHRVFETRKEDGCSATYAHNHGDVKMCSRTREITDEMVSADVCHYRDIQTKLGIYNKLREAGLQIALQGEICGPKINGNKMKLKELAFFVYKIWDIAGKFYWSRRRTEALCNKLGLAMVPVLWHGVFSEEMATVDALLAKAQLVTYGPNVLGEGFVLMSDDDDDQPLMTSFKVLSNAYILKHGR